MKNKSQNPRDHQEDLPGNTQLKSDDEKKVRSGARHSDQIKNLHPGVDDNKKNKSNRLGSPPNSSVNSGDPTNIHSEEDKKKAWPGTINPAK